MSDITASLFGDPVRGRSALDRRNGVPLPAHAKPQAKAKPAEHDFSHLFQKKPRRRLTLDQVRMIRASGEKDQVLAVRFGVSQQAVNAVRQRRSWVNVD